MIPLPSYDALISSIQGFSEDHLLNAAKDWSLGATPSQDLFRSIAELGVFRLQVPKDNGGLEQPFATKCDIASILAAADFGFAMSVINTHNVALRLCMSGSERLKREVVPHLLNGHMSACTALTEKDAGSDVASMKTTARKVDGGWVLTGEKTWIVNARHAGVAIIYAQTGEFGDAGGIGAYLVELANDRVTQYPIDSGFSQTSIGAGGIKLDQVFVPEDALILTPGSAFKSILSEINEARTYVAAMCNSMLLRAIDEAIEYGVNRTIYGGKLSDIPSWCDVIHSAQSAVTKSQDQTSKAIASILEGGDAQLQAARAKVQAVETCQQHLPELLQAVGAEGLLPGRCFTRHLAAAQSAGFTDGATNLLRQRVDRLSA